MEIEYDPAKDAENRAKHGLPLEIGAVVIEAAFHVELDDHPDEERWRVYGWVEGRMLVCVHTMRGSVYRIISVRKATKREVRAWL